MKCSTRSASGSVDTECVGVYEDTIVDTLAEHTVCNDVWDERAAGADTLVRQSEPTCWTSSQSLFTRQAAGADTMLRCKHGNNRPTESDAAGAGAGAGAGADAVRAATAAARTDVS